MVSMKQPRKIILEGKGALTLQPSHYVTSGGEGSIYRVGDTVIKIYADAEKMRREGMSEKLLLLSRFTHESIVAPEGVVTDQSGKLIGFFMPFAPGEPLSRVFTNDFRQRESFGDRHATELVSRMRDATEFAHQGGAVMVDANELNWLAYLRGAKGPLPRVIDVDSWAIGRFPARVIMPSIRDWHTGGFTSASDWFAWGIVTFQIWSGIHPYKGTLDGFAPGDLEARMKANKSVFTKGVRLNRAVRDFSVIPSPLLAWYEATFETNERTKPPSPFEVGIATPRAGLILRVVTTDKTSLVFEKLFDEVGNPVLRVFPCGVILTRDGRLIDLKSKRTIGKLSSADGEVIKVDGGWLSGGVSSGRPLLEYTNEATGVAEELPLPIAAESFLRSGNRLFAITERGITEIVFSIFGKPVLSIGKTWSVLPATKWFDGVGVEDALGAMFLTVPFGEEACAVIRSKELDGLTPLLGTAEARFAAVVTVDRAGRYERHEFTFDREYRSYVHVKSAVDTPSLNMAILPKGVAASIENDGELTVLVPTSGKVVKVADKHIGTDMILSRWDDRVLYIEHGAVWSVRMR